MTFAQHPSCKALCPPPLPHSCHSLFLAAVLTPPNQFLERCKALRYLWLKKMSPELGIGESHESIPVMGSSGIDAAAHIVYKILTTGSRTLGWMSLW